MILLDELNNLLNELLPSNGLTDYCQNGLQVEGKKEVESIATAVSASLETILLAVKFGVDVLIVHHGIFWNHDKHGIKGVLKEKIYHLLLNKISLFAYHLPLDMHPIIGNNWKAAADLGWTDLQPFGFINGVAIGVKGRVPQQSREIVQSQLENYYEHQAICAFGGKKNIETLALISGGSYRSIVEAAQAEVDGFITGNFDEPAWHQAFEEKINFFALGHSATERVGPKALASHLETSLGMPCQFLDLFNPF